MKPFVVFAMPYTRDAWIAAFLSYRDVSCLYNVSLDLKSIDAVYRLLEAPKHGLVDTSLALVWPEIVDHAPHARLVTVRRDPSVVLDEMVSRGFDRQANAPMIERINFALDEIESLSNVLRLEYDDLGQEATAKKLFEFCLPYSWDKEWWEAGKDIPIEISAASLASKVSANAEGYQNTFGSASRYYDRRLAEKRV